MEQLIQHPQLFSNLGIAGVMGFFILYLMKIHNDTKKYWRDKFETHLHDTIETQKEMLKELEVSNTMFKEHLKQTKDLMNEKTQELKNNISKLNEKISNNHD